MPIASDSFCFRPKQKGPLLLSNKGPYILRVYDNDLEQSEQILHKGGGALDYIIEFWNDFLWFININSSLWSFLVTVATAIYVILTYRLLNKNVKARKLQVQPNIIVDLDVSSIFLKMIVKNIGSNSAINVRIQTEPNIDNNPFSNIEFIAPGREISNVI